MGFWELLMLAVGVSMDAFAVSVCKGLSMSKSGIKESVICGAWFGGFQALMPLIGFFLGLLFAEAIEAFEKEECDGCCCDLSFKTMLVMAIATSIDALAVGISLAMAGNVNIWLSILLIGITTFSFSALGVKIGNVFGSRFEKKAHIAGGVILILLGLKILLEHLGILA